MHRLLGQTVFITGASAGIGKACAYEFARHGAHLVLTARRLDRLDSIKATLSETYPNVHVHCAELDVSNKSMVDSVVKDLPKHVRDIDVLINNAGCAQGLDFVENIPEQDALSMFQTNVFGALHVLQAIIPIMRARNTGTIINMGSIAGIQPYARGGVYSASKHALDAISKTLLYELMDTPIRVAEIKPGMVETEFSIVRFKGDDEKAKKVYQGVEALTPHDVAEVAAFMASRPQHVNLADVLLLPTTQAAVTTIRRNKD